MGSGFQVSCRTMRLMCFAALAFVCLPANADGTRVLDIDYVESNGVGAVVVTLSGTAEPFITTVTDHRAIVLLRGATLEKSLERTLDTRDFGGPVTAVSSYRDPSDPNTVRLVVDLEEPATPKLKGGGTRFRIEFERGVKPARGVSAAVAYAPTVVGHYEGDEPASSPTIQRKIYRGKRIDVDFKDVDIHNLLRLLADVGAVNIVVPDDVKATVTVRMRDVPWDQAMEVILASKGLWYRREGNLIRVALRAALDAEDQATAERLKARAQQEAPEPEIFTLNYATAEGMQSQVKPLLSPKGRIEVDPRTNSIIINDVRANRRRVIDLLTKLDTQTPQIQIEARVVEARTRFTREVGIQWGGAGTASTATGNPTGLVFPSSVSIGGGATDSKTPTSGVVAASPDFAVNLPAATGAGKGGAVGFTFGSIGGNVNLSLRLSAAEDKGTVNIVSAPKITVVNNVEATISQGVSIPVSVISAQGVQTQFVPADLELKVTPHVSQRDCSILLNLQVKKNEADFANRGARGDPTILRKEAKTTMLVADGDTSVIGGIYTRNTADSNAKVPFFADIPILGFFFRNRAQSDDRTEVLIFLTPRITNKASLRCEAQAAP